MKMNPYPVILLGFPNVLLMDIAGPMQVYSAVNQLLGKKYYDLQIVSLDGNAIETDTGLCFECTSSILQVPCGGDLIVPGGAGVDHQIANAKFIERLQALHLKRKRIVSVCSGSLLLAKAGILDDHQATSHWSRTNEAKELFPKVHWRPDEIFVHDRNIYTSAGVTAGIDLALSLVELDHGPKLALRIARELVVYIRRSGGQSQFSPLLSSQFGLSETLRKLSDAILQSPSQNWSVPNMADFAAMTERNLSRRFKKEANTSPAKFVEIARVEFARKKLETTIERIDAIALNCGFDSALNLRRAFMANLGVTPTHYRQHFSRYSV